MTTEILPLLSGSLKEIFENILEKHPECKIAEEVLKANSLIKALTELDRISYRLDPTTYNVLKESALKNLSSIITSKARMITFRINSFELSYLPEGKEPIYSSGEVWSRENRQIMKPARLIQKLLVHEFKCKEFEDFSNYLQGEILKSGDFKIVSGDDIVKYYCEDNYYEISGTLGNSCMRYSECRGYFDIYKDHAKLLVYLRDDKVMGRALLWEIDGNTYMDRYYTCRDYLNSVFEEYAISNKWRMRADNSLLYDGDDQYWKLPDDNYKTAVYLELYIKLKNTYDYYPYMDSFRYFDESSNTISSCADFAGIHLSNTDGSHSEMETYTCAVCGRQERCREDESPNDMVWSEWGEEYLCEDCAKYLEYLDSYVRCTLDTTVIYTANSSYEVPTDMLDNGDFACIDGKYYEIESCTNIIYDEENGEYKFKD